MIGIKEVADYAGVSISTVSRVLSGKSYVTQQTREKVLDAVRILDYSPNALAKSLKKGRTDTIALMVPSIQNQMFPIITRGVEDTARKNGFTTILCNTDEDVEIEKSYINKLRTRWIDGIIVSSMLPKSDHIRRLREDGFPVILTSRCYDDTIDAIIIDNYRAAYDGVSYLIRTGHKRIAIALGRIELNIYSERFNGYKAALADNGIPFDPELIIEETNGSNSFYYLTKNLFAKGTIPDAIFATSDPKAIVILRALKDMGIRIPADVSVLGFDNIEMASLVEPTLSTISQPLYEMGALAAKRLISLIYHKEKHSTLPPPVVDVMNVDLVVRKSTR